MNADRRLLASGLIERYRRNVPEQIRRLIPRPIRGALSGVAVEDRSFPDVENPKLRAETAPLRGKSAEKALRVQLRKARAASKAKDWPAALASWQVVLDTEGDNAPVNAFTQLAKAYRALERHEEAKAAIERGLALYPNHRQLMIAHAEAAAAAENAAAASQQEVGGWNNLGLGLNPGDAHYRAYIGQPERYDLVSAMVFNLLTCLGLRQHHRVLDIGCGSLRVGRLLIPYLNPGNYVGVEPNGWLVDDGIANEIGEDLRAIKRPRFHIDASLSGIDEPLNIDIAFAHSVFSHGGIDVIRGWLADAARHLRPNGVLVATFSVGKADHEGHGWVYPGCVSYTPETMNALASEYGFTFQMLDWAHPTQSWALFANRDFKGAVTREGSVSWNGLVRRIYGGDD